MKVIAIMAAAGLAGSACAQSVSWTLIGSMTASGDSVIDPGLGETSATLRFALDLDPGPGGFLGDGTEVKGFASVIAQFLGDSSWQGGDVTWSMNPDLTFLTTDLTEKGGPGYGAQDLHEVNAGQIEGLGTFSTDNPIAIIDITWDALGDYSPRTVSVEAQIQEGPGAQVWVRAPGDDFDTVVDVGVEPLTARFSVIPSPGTFALLGVGALLAARRRRR